MLEYIHQIDHLLESSLCREALPEDDKKCRHCNHDNWAIWRCRDCSMGIARCRACIRAYHKENPFHRIEQWNGNFFRAAELWEVGTYLLVGHHTGESSICDTLMGQEGILETLEYKKDVAEQDRLNRTRSSAPTHSHTSASPFNWGSTDPNDHVDRDVNMDKSDLDVDMDKSDSVAESREDEDYI